MKHESVRSMRLAMMKSALFWVVLVSFVLACCGCAQERSPQEEDAVLESPSEETVADAAVDDGVSLSMGNETGFVIESVQAKRLDESGYSENFLPAGSVWEPGGIIDVRFEDVERGQKDLSMEPDAVNASWSEEGVYLASPIYDLQLTCEGGTILDVHMVDLDGLKGAQGITIGFDEASGLAYLEYQRDGESVNTLESAQYMADAAEAVLQAQAQG